MASFQGPPGRKPLFSFLHASDIHIGSQQFVNLPLAHDYIRALKNILDQAISLQVNFIILGGDIFTSRDLLPNIFQRVVSVLAEFHQKTGHQVPIIAVEGNHDIRRYSHGQKLTNQSSWLRVLNQLGLIILLQTDKNRFPEGGFQAYNPSTRSGSVYRMPSVAIFGSSYHRHDLDSFLTQSASHIPDFQGGQAFHIFIQHFGIAGQMKNVPGVPLKQVRLLKPKVHYLALGHYHLGYQLDNWIFNPGCPEAVSPIETGFKRGVFHVKVAKKGDKFVKTVDHIALVNRPFSWHTVHLPHGLNTLETIGHYIGKSVKNSDLYQRETRQHALPRLFITLRGAKPRNFSGQLQKTLRAYLLQELSAIEVKLYPKFSRHGQSLDNFFAAHRSEPTRESA